MRRHKYLLVSALILIGLGLALRYKEKIRTTLTQDTGFVASGLGNYFVSHISDEDEIIKDDKSVPIQVQKVKTLTPVPRPAISAESYLIGNLETGEVYVEHDSHHIFPIASVSKLFTALIARHVTDPEKKITITQPMLDAYGDAGHLVLGEMFTPDELLNPLVLESSNDAAEAFAQAYGYAEFMTQMNAFAQEIGMNSTAFKDSSGLNPGNTSTASDLFGLAQYLFKYEKPLLSITAQVTKDLATTSDHGFHHFVSINPFSRDPYFIGGKTGRTLEAKESMVSLFNYPVGDQTYPIVIIVLRSDFTEREADTGKLMAKFITLIGSKK